MSATDYNGWTNWETWNLNLWIDNEYDLWKAKVDNLRWVPPSAVDAQFVKTFALEFLPNGTPDFDDIRDYERVNFTEIAEHWLLEKVELDQ